MLRQTLLLFFISFLILRPATAQERLIFLGNSITWHTPSPNIGWTGNWGMAASTQNNDYVHQIANLFAENNKQSIVYPRNISDIENHTKTFDIDKLNFLVDIKPDVVVIFLGDNFKSVEGSNNIFTDRYRSILSKIQVNTTARIFCVTTWWNNKITDRLIYNTCNQSSTFVVDISGISAMQGARNDMGEEFSNSGVAAHPSDLGMRLIATQIFDKIISKNDKKTN